MESGPVVAANAAEALTVAASMLSSIGCLTEKLLEDCAGSDFPLLEAILACVEKAERVVLPANELASNLMSAASATHGHG